MDFSRRGILFDASQLGPYPLEKLPRVSAPAVRFFGEPEKRRRGDNVFAKAASGGYGPKIQERSASFTSREPLDAAFTYVQDYFKAIPESPIAAEKADIPEDPAIMSRHLKRLGYFLGADMVGICRVPEYARYIMPDGSIGGEGLDWAVVLLQVKDTHTIRASHGDEWIDDPVSMRVYQSLAVEGEIMAGYIRRLGWNSQPSVIGKYLTLITPLVIASGLGEASRMGIALNPFVGSCFKAAAVLTDLPLEPDKPIDFGLADYCESCGICSFQCPAAAISKGSRAPYNNYETWKLNGDACMVRAQMNPHGSICERCTKVCPWNRPDNLPRDFETWDGDLEFLYQSVERQATKLRTYGFEHPEEHHGKWWFPLEGSINGYHEAPDFDYEASKNRKVPISNGNK